MGIMQHCGFKRVIIGVICFLLIVCVLLLTACSSYEGSMGQIYSEGERIMDKTVEALVQAIKDQNKTEFVKLFSFSAIEDLNKFLHDADELFSFIRGSDISFGYSTGAASEIEKNGGKVKALAYNSYWLQTEENKYYLAISMCTKDTADESNVGIVSIYVIDAGDWKESYRYLGGGNWVPGIHIDKKSQS